ncbi:bcd family protein [Megaselia abdita]
MAQPPPPLCDTSAYFHPVHHAPAHPHPPPPPHPQMQIPSQFLNPFEMLYDDRTGTLNYNYMRPYIPSQIQLPDSGLSDSFVMRRRRTRTTFTSSQIAELEEYFRQGKYLNNIRLSELTGRLNLGQAQVKIWFKNRRRRFKIEQTKLNDSASFDMPLQLKDVKVPVGELTPSSTPSSAASSPAPPTTTTSSYIGNEIPSQPDTPNCFASGYFFNHNFPSHYPYPTPPTDPAFDLSTHHGFSYGSNPLWRIAPQTPSSTSSEPSPTTVADVYEPLTPKNEDSSPKIRAPDEIEDKSSLLKVDCSPKVTVEPVQSTVDTILQAYSTHRATNAGGQFAYCFN